MKMQTEEPSNAETNEQEPEITNNDDFTVNFNHLSTFLVH